ncbi:MAG: type II toxin-antitoxin system Phd/YefM family antitoxin [Tannerella sp.]|jgi:hypothetical protein|nr:type II toxin-antitoxin system Phd/YefM family antitoxin [Tannerella sp.]
MKVITAREVRNGMKSYFDLAEKEKIVVKRGNGKYIRLVSVDNPDANLVSDAWIDAFMAIPMEYRCNPFKISPSGDLFFADKRNVAHLDDAIRQAKEEGARALTEEEQRYCYR